MPECSESLGSIECPFRVAIIGGGPAGCSIIIRAMRLGLIDEFMDGEYKRNDPPKGSMNQYNDSVEQNRISELTMVTGGVCVVDADHENAFCGGRLKDYIINSNTTAISFVKAIMREKPDNLPPESIVGTALERLKGNKALEVLESYGDRVVPLNLVGNFLLEVGKVLKDVIRSYNKTSRYYSQTKASAIRKHCDAEVGFDGWKIELEPASKNSDESPRVVYAKYVVLATGGRQPLPNLSSSTLQSKVISSDDVCTEEGVRELMKRLKPSGSSASVTKKKTVVIIGGSHSAFSAAWVCLNRIDNNDNVTSSLAMTNSINPTASTSTTSSGAVATSNTCNSPTRSQKSSVHSFVDTNASLFGSCGICILHRSNIRVFYECKREADADNYLDIEHINKSTGQIHAFGGIRGDAKELWRSIRSGRETRVRLIQIRQEGKEGPNNQLMTQTITQKMCDDANVIIWACGYNTNAINVYDAKGKKISIRYYRGQVDVDDRARVLLDSDSSVSQSVPLSMETLFGTGLGFGLKATFENGDPDGSSGRADGVGVYLKRSATLILFNIFGNKVFGGTANSWEERAAMIRRMRFQREVMTANSSNSNINHEITPTAALSPNIGTRKRSQSRPHLRSTSTCSLVKEAFATTDSIVDDSGDSTSCGVSGTINKGGFCMDRIRSQLDSISRLSAPRLSKTSDEPTRPKVYLDESTMMTSVARLSRPRALISISHEHVPTSSMKKTSMKTKPKLLNSSDDLLPPKYTESNENHNSASLPPIKNHAVSSDKVSRVTSSRLVHIGQQAMKPTISVITSLGDHGPKKIPVKGQLVVLDVHADGNSGPEKSGHNGFSGKCMSSGRSLHGNQGTSTTSIVIGNSNLQSTMTTPKRTSSNSNNSNNSNNSAFSRDDRIEDLSKTTAW